MISEGDGGSYMDKYPQESGRCQTDRTTPEDSNAERLLSDTNGSPTAEGSNISRKPILEQDRFLPIANISRLMKNVIPRSGKVAKDAKECVQECVSEFISFITSEACDRCLSEKRKTITGEDIIGAFSTLGFDNYVDPLNAYVRKFREAFRTERNNETLLVEPSGSHPSLLDKLATHDPNESAVTGDVFTIQNEPVPTSSACSSQIIFAGEEEADGSVRLMSTGNVQHLQLLMDPATGQHYINVQSPNGTQQLLPVQVTAVSDSGATPLTASCLETQSSMNIKPEDKGVPDFPTRTEYRPSGSKSGDMPSTSYKEVPRVTQQSVEQSRNRSAFASNLRHGSAGRSTANHQHKQQVPYGGSMGQFGQHRSVGAREQPRKRSHESVEYVSF